MLENVGVGEVLERSQGLGQGPGQGQGEGVMDVVDTTTPLHHEDLSSSSSNAQSLALKAQQLELEHFNKSNSNHNNHNSGNDKMEVGGAGIVGVVGAEETHISEVINKSGGEGGESGSASSDVKEGVSGDGNSSNADRVVERASMLRRGPRLLLELTRDPRMMLIVEHWRRADAFTWLLKEIAKMGDEGGASYATHRAEAVRMANASPDMATYNKGDDNKGDNKGDDAASGVGGQGHGGVAAVVDGNRARAHRSFLIRRQVICQLVDIFTADQSPAKGQLYPPGTRRTAPSSYVPIPPPTVRGGSLCAAAKNIPDWTDLLETLRLLVCTGTNEGMETDHGVPPTLFVPYPSASVPLQLMAWSAPRLDQGSHLCLAARTMYSIALRQGGLPPCISTSFLFPPPFYVSFFFPPSHNIISLYPITTE